MQNFNNQKNPSKNKWVTNSTRIVLPIFIIGGFSGLGYLVYRIISNNFSKTQVKYDLGTSLKSNDQLFVEFGLEKDKDYVFDQNELNELRNDFFAYQYYGPELAEVNSIVLGDRNVIDPTSSVSGLTIPQTNEIFIDLSQFQDIYNGMQANHVSPEDQYKVKRDWVFSVLAHEYGHHLTSTYFNNAVNVNSDASIYSTVSTGKNSSERVIEYWNKQYIQDFKSVFNIDSDLGSKLQPNESQGQFASTNISSKYSLNNLYHFANDKEMTNANAESDNLTYFNSNSSYNQSLPMSDDINTYLYNQDEIGTRMLQQSFFSDDFFNYNSSGSDWNTQLNLLKPGSQYQEQGLKYYKPYAQDILMTSGFNLHMVTSKAIPEVIYPNYIWGTDPLAPYQYLDGNNQVVSQALSNRSEQYYTDLIHGMGYGKDIAKLWFLNKTYTINGETIEKIDNKNYYDPQYVKWVGYYPTTDPATSYSDIVTVRVGSNGVAKQVLNQSTESAKWMDIKIGSEQFGGDNSVANDDRSNPSFNFFAKQREDVQFNPDTSAPTYQSRALNTTDFWNPTNLNPNDKMGKYNSYVVQGYQSRSQSNSSTGYVSASELSSVLSQSSSSWDQGDYVALYYAKSSNPQLSELGPQLKTLNDYGQTIDPNSSTAYDCNYVSSMPAANFDYYQKNEKFWMFTLRNGKLYLENAHMGQQPNS